MSFLDDYEPVEDRIRAFWSDRERLEESGSIVTKLLHHGDGHYIVHADLLIAGFLVATGLAHEDVASLPNNMKASALEVCETSAIGRALANLGYAAKGKRPSREEMSAATSDSSAAPGVEGIPSRPPPGILSVAEVSATGSAGEGGQQGTQAYGEGAADSEGTPSPATSEKWAEIRRRAGTNAAALEWVNAFAGPAYNFTARTVLTTHPDFLQDVLDAHPQEVLA